VRKAHNMFAKLNVPVLGVVENMSYFEVPGTGEKHYIFGNGGGEALAERYGVAFLGAVPLAQSVREGGDLGVPIVVGAPESGAAKVFRQIAENVAAQVSISAIKTNKTLPVLNLKRGQG
jgi:ATP-binding protein involved in chromosome partitioning